MIVRKIPRSPGCAIRRGFSLIEVVLALGLVSFALLAMTGLLSLGFTSSRESVEDTNLALASETALSVLRSHGFVSVSANADYEPGDAAPDFYFDASGSLAVDANGLPATAPDSETQYACTVTRFAPTLDQATTHLLYLRLEFTWPWAAPAAHRQHRVVMGSLVNDD